MGLSWREKKSCWVAQRIDRGMDLGAHAASAAFEGLFVWIPPFAPALCWWARTMVASIMGVFVVRILCQGLEHTLPYAAMVC